MQIVKEVIPFNEIESLTTCTKSFPVLKSGGQEVAGELDQPQLLDSYC